MAEGGDRNQTNDWNGPFHNDANDVLIGPSIATANFYSDSHAAAPREAWPLQKAGNFTFHRVVVARSRLIAFLARLS